MFRKRWITKTLWGFSVLFVIMNLVAFFHAYKFTHFDSSGVSKKRKPEQMSTSEKMKALVFGVSNPRPENKTVPSVKYSTLKFNCNGEIESWYVPAQNSIGTVILFHGYGSSKSALIERSEIFNFHGYNTMLVDFMGSGGSSGNVTTIGSKEADQVKACFDVICAKGEKKIILFGTSMGAVAIMKSINDHNIEPEGIVLECPFGTMYQAVCSRFKSMEAPTFPMASLLVFWGGIQHGFWAFGHNPEEYALNINCPVLMLHGARDKTISESEIQSIFNNIQGNKKLSIYEEAGHENYLNRYRNEWTNDVVGFLTDID